MAHSYAQVDFIKTVRIGSPLYVVNGKMLFASLDANNEYQLWVSDGTDVGTTILKSFYTVIGSYHGGNMYPSDGYAGEGLYNPIVFNNELYFFANDPANNHTIVLWKSDGTPGGTSEVKNMDSYFSQWAPSTVSFCIFNNALYFSGGSNSNKLWKTDGGIPTEVIDLNNGSLAWGPRYMTVFNNALYFTANDGTTGVEIWKSDGTAAGTHLLKDIFPGSAGVENKTSVLNVTIPQFIVSGNFLYFTGYRDQNSNFLNLYRTDGTETFTIQLNPNIYKELPDLQPFQADAGGTLLFGGYPDGNSTGTSNLMKSNGTVSGTTEVITNNNLKTYGMFTSFKNKAFFAGRQGTGGSTEYGLCVSDGTTDGTSMVYSFPYGSDANTMGFLSTPNSLFFREKYLVGTSATTPRIVQTDGPHEGTKIFYGAIAWGDPTLYNGYIYFLGSDTTAVYSSSWGLCRLLPIPQGGALPVTLTNFKVSLSENKTVSLKWQTASEINSKGFDIERSEDGTTFISLGFVASFGQSYSLQNYSFTDNKPLEGSNYYRLKQKDLNGKYVYSQTREIEIISEKNICTINPNPVSGNILTIQHHLPTGNTELHITDITGRVIIRKSFVVNNAVAIECNIPQLISGTYILQIMQKGRLIGTKRFIKE